MSNILLNMLGLLAGEGVLKPIKSKYKPNDKMPLNIIETQKLSSLRGRAKKKYIKELKKKYYGKKSL